jgi:diguanylate cyclase (GGDEF)-like protein
MRRAERQSPFRREGLLRRAAPFLVAMVLGYAAIRLPAVQRDTGEILAAALLNLVLVGLVAILPWDELPRIADIVPPLVYMVVVALLRDAAGGAVSAYSTLLILPVLWLAMYGTRAQLAVGVVGVAVLLTMPVLLIGKPDYTDEEWRRALLWVTVSGIIGLAVQDLVEQVRQRAEALHTVSEAVGRRTREIETRSAICEAAKENAKARYAVMLEPDANARRLVATAATDRLVESTEIYLNDTGSGAVRTYTSAREQFQAEVNQPPFLADNGTYTEVASVLWHPVPGRDGPLGVLGVAWTDPIKRLPDTLPAVMEALAAEAAGVIERTTLLLRLETVVKTDEVTGLPNERAWEEEVPRELSRARRQGTPLSVVIMDLGDFELSPDDQLGHRDKDFLGSAADRWRAEIGPSDFLAHRDPPGRFSILFPNLGSAEAADAALRMQAAAPAGRECVVAVATWNGVDLPAALVGRAETQIELEKAAARAD